jgi:hypothetical protein
VWKGVIVISMAVLALLGCHGGDEAIPVERSTTTVFNVPEPPDPNVLTREERVLQWITSCEVRKVLVTEWALDMNVVYIRFRNGDQRRVRLGDDATADRVFAAAIHQRCADFKVIAAIE